VIASAVVVGDEYETRIGRELVRVEVVGSKAFPLPNGRFMTRFKLRRVDDLRILGGLRVASALRPIREVQR
jgi:hypothetical protein